LAVAPRGARTQAFILAQASVAYQRATISAHE